MPDPNDRVDAIRTDAPETVAQVVREEFNKVVEDSRTLRDSVDALVNGAPGIAAKLTLVEAAVVAIQEGFNAALAQLDADGGVTDTDYAATHEVEVLEPEEVDIVTRFNAVVAAVTTLETEFNGALAKLDDDATVTGTDYEATHAVTPTDPEDVELDEFDPEEVAVGDLTAAKVFYR